jgi:hypothetical protein
MSAKNLTTETPVALTTSWVLVLPTSRGRNVLIVRNVGADAVRLSTNDPDYVDGVGAENASPRDTTKFFTLPSGEAISFERCAPPLVLRARADATTATLHMIVG